MTERVDIDNMGPRISRIMESLTAHNREIIGKAVADMPRRFRNEVLAHYPTVLNVRTGRLRQSFQEFARRVNKDEWEVGMSSDVEYAAIHEFGGKTGRNHAITITEKRFFRDPMEMVADTVFREIEKELGFKSK